MSKKKVNTEDFVNPFNEGVTYQDLLNSIPEGITPEDYLKDNLSEDEIKVITNELKLYSKLIKLTETKKEKETN